MDAATAAGLETREVRTGTRDGEPTRVVVAERSYPTDRADLWAALTDPERIARWFLPVTGDLVVGGHYQLEGQAGGVVEACTPPESFRLTWGMGGSDSWVLVTLTPQDDATVLRLEHESVVDPEFWERFGPGAVGVGWGLALWSLGEHVVGAPPPAQDDPAYVEVAAPAWAEAAVAGGEDPGQARAAGERTRAFYTGAAEA